MIDKFEELSAKEIDIFSIPRFQTICLLKEERTDFKDRLHFNQEDEKLFQYAYRKQNELKLQRCKWRFIYQVFFLHYHRPRNENSLRCYSKRKPDLAEILSSPSPIKKPKETSPSEEDTHELKEKLEKTLQELQKVKSQLEESFNHSFLASHIKRQDFLQARAPLHLTGFLSGFYTDLESFSDIMEIMGCYLVFFSYGAGSDYVLFQSNQPNIPLDQIQAKNRKGLCYHRISEVELFFFGLCVADF